MFYVYEWYIVNTGEVIYVGKGTNSRYKVRKHNRLFNEMIKRFYCKSRIIKEFESEQDAFEYEYVRIKELKEQGQCVCNIAKGGYGGDTHWWTDELRKKYSENNVMKSEIQRKRMRERNPMRDFSIAERVGWQKGRAVIIDGIRYYSVKEAALKYNTSYDTIANWCKKGINSKGQLCRFEDSEQVIFEGGRYNKGGCRPMTYLGVHYECAKDCSEALGIRENTLNHWLKRGWDIQGNECRYDDDTRNNPYENPFKGKPATPVIVNGVRYESIHDACSALGIKKPTLYTYLQGKRKSTKYICAYDNQQPNRTNSSKSSTKGSTTNE